MNKKRILVVDDEPELVKAMQIRLEQENYEVLVAYDGEEGLQKAQEYKPDLIILDILMPKMGGDVAGALLKKNKETSDIPILFLTALAEGLTEKSEDRFRGGNFFLGKPFDTNELMSMVKSLLKSE